MNDTGYSALTPDILEQAVEQSQVDVSFLETGRKIPTANEIQLYFHCARCLESKPVGYSPAGWKTLEAGWTALGLQVWCRRHSLNVVHIDFQGVVHATSPSGVWQVKGEVESQESLLRQLLAALPVTAAEDLAVMKRQEPTMILTPLREIPVSYEITSPIRCPKCAAHQPEDTDLDDLAAGWTVLGLQVWCEKHGCNVLHIDFQGIQHTGATSAD